MRTDDLRDRAKHALALSDAAEPGPWEIAQRNRPRPVWHVYSVPRDSFQVAEVVGPKTAQFIAEARELLPELADAVLTLTEESEELRVDAAVGSTYQKVYMDDSESVEQWKAKAVRAQAENEALRKAVDKAYSLMAERDALRQRVRELEDLLAQT